MTDNLNEKGMPRANGAVPVMPNGAVPVMPNGAVPVMQNGAVPVMPNGAVPVMPNGAVPVMPNGAVPVMPNGAVPAPSPVRPVTGLRDSVFAILLAILSVFSVSYGFFGDFNLGFTISVLLAVALICTYLFTGGAKPAPLAVFCFAAAAAAAVPFTLYTDSFSKFWLFVAICVLLSGGIIIATGQHRHKSGSPGIIIDILRSYFYVPFAKMAVSLSSTFARKGGESKKKKGITVGILCAIPVLAVIIPLLASSDAAFEGLLSKLYLIVPEDLFPAVILAAIVFPLLFSQIFAYSHKLVEGEKAPVKKASPGKLPPASVSAFLGCISFVYIVYLISQLAYFVNAFSGILPDEYTAAEYARRGFAEMAIICAVNFALVALAVLLSRKGEDGRDAVSVRIAAVFIGLFNVFLIVCSVAKMFMYINRFGMTRMRICTSVFMIMLAVAVIAQMIHVFAARFPYMKAIIIFITLIGLTVGYADIDTVVARYNTEAYLSGRLAEIDIDSLGELSDTAVVYLDRLSKESTDPTVKKAAHERIVVRAYSYFGYDYEVGDDEDGEDEKRVVFLDDEDNGGLRRYNVSYYRAREIVRQAAIDDPAYSFSSES